MYNFFMTSRSNVSGRFPSPLSFRSEASNDEHLSSSTRENCLTDIYSFDFVTSSSVILREEKLSINYVLESINSNYPRGY